MTEDSQYSSREEMMGTPSSWPWNSRKIDDLQLHYNKQSKLFGWPMWQSYTPTQGYILTSKNSCLSWLIDWQCSGIAFTGTCGSPIQIKCKAICYNRYLTLTLDNATDKTGNSNQVIGSTMITSVHQQYWLIWLFLEATCIKAQGQATPYQNRLQQWMNQAALV